MLSVKNELLATLATALDAISPGAGAKAAFESPKVAAHGDFACTAAMQLAMGILGALAAGQLLLQWRRPLQLARWSPLWGRHDRQKNNTLSWMETRR